jgi:hypothetical protein
MIPKDCKRLAEVDFPIAEVSRHAAREKSIRHGHPSTLHLWWARRPLASSRAVLLSLLWPDPCDPLCPPEFKEQARKLLPQVGGRHPGATDAELRKALLKFIAHAGARGFPALWRQFVTPEVLRSLIADGKTLDVESKYVESHGSISRREVAELCRPSQSQACGLLKRLAKQGKIRQVSGSTKAVRYGTARQ